MSVIRFKEIHDGRDGEDTYRSGRVVTRYTRMFRAVTDNNADNGATILAYSDCPRIGWVFPSDSRAFCQTVLPRNEPFSKRVWIVTAGYSTERELSENPTDDPVRIEWNTEDFQRIYEKDRDGDAIVNSAGDPYDPPLEDDDSRLVAHLQANLTAIPAWWASYRDAVNDNNIVLDGYPVDAGNAKIKRMALSPIQYRNGVPFRVLSVDIHISEEGWAREVLDQGFRKKDGADRIMITDDNGTSITAPVPLDGSGDVLADPTPATVVYNTHNLRNEKDFTVFPGIVAGGT